MYLHFLHLTGGISTIPQQYGADSGSLVPGMFPSLVHNCPPPNPPQEEPTVQHPT